MTRQVPGQLALWQPRVEGYTRISDAYTAYLANSITLGELSAVIVLTRWQRRAAVIA